MLENGLYNMDCMKGMREFPDKYFDLAIVDPPYGIGYDKKAHDNGGKQWGKAKAPKKQYRATDWDNATPPAEYFTELRRVSKNQIIWGGNYFADKLPPSRGFIVWYKRLDGVQNPYADCEQAWINPELGVARLYRYLWTGMLQGNMRDKEERIHPTQKPVALYKWLLTNYAHEGDLILDTHVGSASSLIACEDLGYQYVGFEIDEEYYRLAQERIKEFNAQLRMF